LEVQKGDTMPTSSAAALTDALGSPRRILVTGGTGFVGQRLVQALVEGGHRVTVLSRSADSTQRLPGAAEVVATLDQLPDASRIDAVVNLAGEPIADGLWTRTRRERIVASRLAVAEAVRSLLMRLDAKPSVLVTASAIGWYGIRGDEGLDETSAGTPCFSRDVCVAVEEAAGRVEALGVRCVPLRIGLVLGEGGGLLGRMLLPYKFGLGGPFGNGQHWMSWIHRDDLVRLICHAIADPSLAGPVNATSPNPVRNRDFSKALGKALNRPAFLAVPAWPLKFALGDMARELLLGGQRVLPAAAERAGFVFRYPQLHSALRAIVGKS
jgi:uncharacterized protein (TIGR01777 family)